MNDSSCRRLFIGDIHGCLDELQDLLRACGHDPGDEVVLVGDLVNKGPDSAGVIALTRSIGARVVQGNHDDRLVRALRTPPEQRSSREDTLLLSMGPRIVDHLEWLEALPLWICWPDLWCVHAGLQPGVSHPSAMERRMLLTIRTWDGIGEILDRQGDPAWFEADQWPVPVVFGHWSLRGLVDLPHAKGLDTGCVYGGKLTAWSPDENRFWQVSARRAWAPFAPS